MSEFAIISIATGAKYLNYWKNLVISIKTVDKSLSKVKFYLLTDNPLEAKEFGTEQNVELQTFKIESYGWPEATLLRYREILKIENQISEPVLIYLDSDMLVMRDFISSLEPDHWENSIALVSHPGFWRPQGKSGAEFYFKNPKIVLKDLFTFIRFGSLGSWERNSQSFAYVKRTNRKIYVCGGIWMGKRDNLIELIKYCSKNVDLDLQNGYVAIWHDESHLNLWSSAHKSTILNPAYCFDPTYKNLNGLREIVRAVSK